MPLRYAFEGMLIGQATRNHFEIERIRLQRKIDRFLEKKGEASVEEIERLEMAKEGLRRLLASGAIDTKEAQELVTRIRRMVDTGSPIEVSTMKVWPKGDDVLPTYKWFVNDRIELLVREAETFRNDYRNKEPRHVFFALEKPIPFYDLFSSNSKEPENAYTVSPSGQIKTMKFCGIVLLSVSIGCCLLSARFIRQQNRKVT